MTIVVFHWTGIGYMGGPVRYRRTFATPEDAQACTERVLEGRGEARYSVRCDDGILRRLGTADSAYTTHLIDRRKVAA
jgi:hypothetical protein